MALRSLVSARSRAARCCARAASTKGMPDVEERRSSMLFTLKDGPGALSFALGVFAAHDVNISRIESRPNKRDARLFDFVCDIEGRPGQPNVDAALGALRPKCAGIEPLPATLVPWFPTKAADLDSMGQTCIYSGAGGLAADHPGFSDKEYKDRRDAIAKACAGYVHGAPIPRVAYTPSEVGTWAAIYDKQAGLWEKHACTPFKRVVKLLEQNVNFKRDNIPQLNDVSEFLKDTTGFCLRPVTGLLSARDFLNALAFRVFGSTQYIRHHSRPLYTPEPDVVHELMGHAPMLADPDFADFSQEIGLASLGASDADVRRLATCYWFSVEFGLCMERGERKAYGAGILSSFGELEYACSPTRPAGGETSMPEYLPWDPAVAARTDYPITTYQPKYFVAESITDAKDRMRAFAERDIVRGFNVRYNPYTQSVDADRAIVRSVYAPTLQKEGM